MFPSNLYYPGVLGDLSAIGEGGVGVVAVVDVPFSLVADTVLLPSDIAHRRKTAKEQRTHQRRVWGGYYLDNSKGGYTLIGMKYDREASHMGYPIEKVAGLGWNDKSIVALQRGYRAFSDRWFIVHIKTGHIDGPFTAEEIKEREEWRAIAVRPILEVWAGL